MKLRGAYFTTMSEELSKCVDQFLSYTDIQSHQYGVPSVDGISFTDQNDIYEQEIQYRHLYDAFLQKVNRLIYLNELKSLKHESLGIVEQEFDGIVQKLPITAKQDYQEIIRYLRLQNDQVKTKSLLNTYLQITLPILKSIHHLDFESIASEKSISDSLSILFSKLNQNLDSNVNSLMQTYKLAHDKSIQLNNLRSEVSRLLEELSPKLTTLYQYDRDLSDINSETYSNNTELLRDTNFNQVQIRNKFNQLLLHWTTISILLTVIPNFIMCLPVDWFSDKICLNIIEQCGEISDEFDKYHRLINQKSMNDMNINDLLMIGLELYGDSH